MTETEQALYDGCGFLLDYRHALKAVLKEPEIAKMNAVLKSMATALENSIDAGWPAFRAEMVDKNPAWAGTFMSHKEFINGGRNI